MGIALSENYTVARAQALLDSGVEVEGDIYNVDGDYAFRAHTHGPDLWHGHPIPWSRLPNEARRGLIASGRLTDAQWRNAIRKHLGSETA